MDIYSHIDNNHPDSPYYEEEYDDNGWSENYDPER